MEEVILQAQYGAIEIDNREVDIVQIFSSKGDVIQIERQNLPVLISMLSSCIAEPKVIEREIGDGC